MDELAPVIARVAFVGVMVIGGSIFAFSTFIMASLKQLPDQEGIRAMQQINESVFTPWFMAPFFGTAALSLVAVVIATSNTDQRWWLSLLGAVLSWPLRCDGGRECSFEQQACLRRGDRSNRS